MFRAAIVAIFEEVFVEIHIKKMLRISFELVLMSFCNISFCRHLPEDGQNKWPKHVGGLRCL